MTRTVFGHRVALLASFVALSVIGAVAAVDAQDQGGASKPKASAKKLLKGSWYSIAWGYKNQTAVDEYDYRVDFFDDEVEIDSLRFAYTIDEKKSPKEIDLYYISSSGEKKAESRPGLFALKRGTLLLQLAEKSGDKRPDKLGMTAN